MVLEYKHIRFIYLHFFVDVFFLFVLRCCHGHNIARKMKLIFIHSWCHRRVAVILIETQDQNKNIDEIIQEEKE